ncbi:Os02g0256000 [Oryza sativa Japonica Group]|uniref:Os02g0256000 protein n=2 Tax=Oryza sativa subsp. japonica TaxID=39947 RepID=Q0E2A7_ORYSJ|nr:hypothetical protein EE612_010179 [Oryza sativa]BAD27951.1 unknown protein [Oryza sativa Japonica Group]BAD29698.1 unknown protein [Oryza sativa Japonica Group]BAF08381.1 Os02g0256000 [Oryza sativa Japonica Group]BAS77953.1 Os02g0256000 [Oryza sativa Japonica Group]|eukprot:NP_001046467.1 Os02g0256000 [Oryza sativa Japonica Group]
MSRRPSPWMKLVYLAPGSSLPLPYDGSGSASGQLLVSCVDVNDTTHHQEEERKRKTWPWRWRGESETCVALRTAPLARKRVMWLVRLKLPVSHVPAGTSSVVPPRRRWCWMRYTALWNAHVFTVRPSPTPPNSAMDTVSGRGLAGTAPAHVVASAASHCTNNTTSSTVTAKPCPCNAAIKEKMRGNCLRLN